jgi:hypothetical protein
VGDQNITNLAIALRQGVRVSGRVDYQGNPPWPANQRPNVSLVPVRPMFRNDRARPQPSGPVDADGAFSIPGVVPGRYLVRVNTAIRPPWSVESVLVAGSEASEGFNVERQSVGDVVIRLTMQPAVLTGTVTTSGTRSAGNASVFIFPSSRAGWADAPLNTPGAVQSLPATTGFARFRIIRVSASGEFMAPNMMPGEYLVAAADETNVADWPDEKFLEKLAGIAKAVRIGPAQQVNLSLPLEELR